MDTAWSPADLALEILLHLRRVERDEEPDSRAHWEQARVFGIDGRKLRGLIASLRRRGWVTGPSSGPRLTDTGREFASETLRRRRISAAFLVSLGLSLSEAQRAAARLAQGLSTRTADALHQALGSPARAPCGHVIDGAPSASECVAMLPLSQLPQHTYATIERVPEGCPALIEEAALLGLLPGARVHVETRREAARTLLVRVDARPPVTIGTVFARHIEVRPLSNTEDATTPGVFETATTR